METKLAGKNNRGFMGVGRVEKMAESFMGDLWVEKMAEKFRVYWRVEEEKESLRGSGWVQNPVGNRYGR